LDYHKILAKTDKTPLRIGGINVFPPDAMRDIGIILDLKLTMENHVDSVM